MERKADEKKTARFAELEKMRKSGSLQAHHKVELRGLVRELGMFRDADDTYCYCEENNFACNPDNPWPGCTCKCVNMSELN